MKKTRSEMKRDLIKNEGNGNSSEDEQKSKRKKKSKNLLDNNDQSSSIDIKPSKLEEFYTKMYHNIKIMIEKFETKPEVFDKDFEINGERLSKIQNLSKFKVVSQLELYYKHKYEER